MSLPVRVRLDARLGREGERQGVTEVETERQEDAGAPVARTDGIVAGRKGDIGLDRGIGAGTVGRDEVTAGGQGDVADARVLVDRDGRSGADVAEGGEAELDFGPAVEAKSNNGVACEEYVLSLAKAVGPRPGQARLDLHMAGIDDAGRAAEAW